MNPCTFLVLLLLPALKCFPLGFTEVTKEEVKNTGIDVKEISENKPESFINSQKDSIEKDWQEIIESTRLLEEDAKKVDVDPYYPEQLDTIRQEIDQVNCCQNLLIHVFGAPGGPIPHFVDRPKEAWEIKGKKGFLELYNQSIWSLVSLVKATSENDNLTTGMHHIDINCKKCGFQTLEFIKKYNLAPDLMEEIERFLKSRPGLKWFGDSSSYIFQNKSRLDNKFHWDFRNEEHLKFHFHLIHYNKIFQRKFAIVYKTFNSND
ncbi:hypothetical protein PGTUg99_019121 [Puccinia graminis f. sp. tritici]|uniref:Uncharacterized protein n=1 Tax=Puccinia graminis f. sp. tritici TaxID=56615 RepID=A0A5B0REK0_PUCGR|nr:hypothetical protein PGTUg99_019121 [Puccinia graminis f. sp. tritici]